MNIALCSKGFRVTNTVKARVTLLYMPQVKSTFSESIVIDKGQFANV